MRIDNAAFTSANKSATKEPVIVVELAFDSANTDLYYLCTHSVSGLSGVNVIDNCVEKVAGTSQKLNPDKALSTIGSMSFSALDVGLTELQKTKLNSNLGLKGKRVRFYVGDASLVWSDFILAQTQIVESVDYKDTVYSFKCSDVQRQMRKDIFEPKKTAISANVMAGATTINVYKTSEFQRVKQPASPSGITDAPGQKVGYLKLSNGCIVRYTGKTSASFTGCTWGVFDTKHLIEDIEKPSDTGPDNAPKVEEFIYLEMPAVMLAYALLTGSLYNDPGEFLPDHWNLGIDTQYVRTVDFAVIGNDWWDLSNNDLGVPAVVKGVKKTDGKKFIEEQLYMMLGAFSPVYANGELGLKRMTVIPSQGGYVRELNVDNIVSYGSLTHDMKSVINFAVLDWNYVIGRDSYTRKNIMPDTLSIARHGQSDTKELKFRTLETSRHSYATIKSRFDSLRDRYAGPPLRLKLTLLPSQNDLEIGDIVRVNLEHVKDYTGEEIDGTLDRNFEVQQVSTDWVSGRVSVDLFGSSQSASALPPAEPGVAIPDAWYSSQGTEISAANFGGSVSSSGGVTTISGNINFAGHAALLNPNAIYYCNEDLTINAGVTVTINNNVQIRVKGFFQCNGTIDGKGRGLTGGVGSANNGQASNAGKKGFLGSTISQDGVSDVETYSHHIAKHNVFTSTSSWVKSANNRNSAIIGQNQTAPILSLSTDASATGIPSDLRGCSGSAGGSLLQRVPGYGPLSDGDGSGSYSKPSEPDIWYAGGNGGASGAGLFIVCRGMDMGANAKIDLSGIDGAATTPVSALYPNRDVYAGCGAGGYTGACYIVLDGISATAPTLNSSNAIAEVGKCPVPSGGYNVITTAGAKGNDYGPLYADFGSANVGAQRERVNTYESNFRIQYLTGFIESTPDTPTHADAPLGIALSESTNTPPTAGGNLSSVEVTITPPADTNYSYARVYYRVSGDAGWHLVGPASHETFFTVPSDGKTYEVGAQAVSKQGNESSGGVSAFITLTDVINLPTDIVIGGAAPLVGINAITLKDYAGTEFAGRDAKFQWDNLNAELEHFLHYKIQIVDTSTNVVRTETVTDPFFVYTYEKNSEDYQNQNASVGANRQFTIKVTPIARNRNNLGELYAGTTASLTVSNPAPALPTALTVSPGFKIARFEFDRPTDLDYEEIRIWGAETTGFTVNDSTLVATSKDGPITITGLTDDTTYYYRLAAFDAFGMGTLSAEHTITTQDANIGSGLGPWATVTDVDRAFIDANMDNNAIEGDKIVKLTASKLVAGTLAATEAISCEGIIESKVGTYSVTMGPKDFGDPAMSLFSFANGSTKIVTFNEDGVAQFTGEVNVTGGTINGTSSATVASGANKANYGFNASGHLQTVIDGNQLPITPAGTGLNITGHRMGYYNGTEWKSFMDKDGKFYLDGNATNKLWWDGNSLTVRGDIHATSVETGSLDSTTITGALIRTAASGQRVEIVGASNKMTFTDSGGTSRLTLDDASSSRGYIDVTGTSTKYGFSARNCKYGSYSVNCEYGFVATGASAAGFHADVSSGKGVIGSSSGNVGVEGTSYSLYGGKFTSSTNVGMHSTGVHGVYAIGNSTGRGVYGVGKYGGYLDGTTYDAYLAHGTVGPFTGGHDALLLKTATGYEPGDIFTIDSIIGRSSISNTIPAVSQSSAAQSQAAYGVLSVVQSMPDIVPGEIEIAALKNKTETEYNTLKSNYDHVVLNGVGEGQINVCDEGGDFAVGDFICTSTVAGKGKLYTGNDMRVVVAKISEPVDWSAEAETTKMVACIYMCG